MKDYQREDKFPTAIPTKLSSRCLKYNLIREAKSHWKILNDNANDASICMKESLRDVTSQITIVTSRIFWGVRAFRPLRETKDSAKILHIYKSYRICITGGLPECMTSPNFSPWICQFYLGMR